MDFMLEEELVDLMTYCLQNPSGSQVEENKKRISEIGKEIYEDGGVDAMENFFFALKNRIYDEIGKDPSEFRKLWNGISSQWN